jgi:hypothetical protein
MGTELYPFFDHVCLVDKEWHDVRGRMDTIRTTEKVHRAARETKTDVGIVLYQRKSTPDELSYTTFDPRPVDSEWNDTHGNWTSDDDYRLYPRDIPTSTNPFYWEDNRLRPEYEMEARIGVVVSPEYVTKHL